MQGVKGNTSLTKWSIPCHIPHCFLKDVTHIRLMRSCSVWLPKQNILGTSSTRNPPPIVQYSNFHSLLHFSRLKNFSHRTSILILFFIV